MRIVILGANGQVGREVFRRCCAAFPAAEVIGCVRHKHLHFEGCKGDKRQHSFAFDPFKDNWNKLGTAGVLINCIGIIRESGDLTFEEAHTGLTRLMLQNRKLLGMPKIIQVSVLGAGKQSQSAFMRTKAAADEELLAHEDTFVVRPSIVCTPGTMMVKKLNMLGRIAKLSFNKLLFPERLLTTAIQPVMGSDVADVIAKIAAGDSIARIINVTGPERIAIKELLSMLNKGRVSAVPLGEKASQLLLSLAGILAPRLIDREQLTLLSIDNTASNNLCIQLLQRPMLSTANFWKHELK